MRVLLRVFSACCSVLLLWPVVSAGAQADFDVFESSIAQMQQAMEQGETSSVELVEQYLARIAAYDKQGPRLNSIIRINPEAATVAAALDAERQRSGARSMLHGVPILVKDNYNTDDMPTTGGSVALADFVPSANATQIDKLIAAGAVILAKTNLHEYAYGITSVSSLLGQTRNPYDPRRVPGGSSGGTAAAVAASFGAIGLGSDTCGSIRIPSAFNNLIGLRPSKGLSSIYGVMPLSHTQDVAGPLARNADDLAILLDIVAGYDANDAATEVLQTQSMPAFRDSLGSVDLDGLRFGKLESYFERAAGAVRQQNEQALEWYESQGVEIVEVEIPELGSMLSASGLIGHEFRIDLNQYLALFLSEKILNLNDIVDLGLYHEAVQGALTRSRASVYNDDAYTAALAARGDLRRAIEQVLAENDLDAIVYPPIAELQVFTGESQPGNNCSISANSGLPALSMPAGFTESGLPVGMELLGAFFDDARLLAIAQLYEQGQQSRQAPSTTPPLIDGEAPAATLIELNFNEQGTMFESHFEFDVSTNRFSYTVNVAASNSAEIYAVTLLIDEEEAFQLNDPIVVNLMGPGVSQSSGDYFMSPGFREAFAQQRVYLRVFASSFAPAGATARLQ